MLEEGFEPLRPNIFFQMQAMCLQVNSNNGKKKSKESTSSSDTSLINHEEKFAKVFTGWSSEDCIFFAR